MKRLIGIFLLCLTLICCMGAGPCWIRHNDQANQYYYGSEYPIYAVPTYYYPVVTQQITWTPIIQHRTYYVPVTQQYYMNYRSYYNYQLYTPRYNSGPWQGYNY